jgi:hypothetical protein
MTGDPSTSAKLTERILDPMDRMSEVLFGLIMALTFTCTLGVATADNIQVRTMLFGALGCNLAWGIIDGGVYLMARLNQRGRNLMRWRRVCGASDANSAHHIIRNSLPPVLASALTSEHLESIRRKILQMPDPGRPRLTREDLLGALGICLLSFLATFPIVIPFLLFGEARLALRVSNAVAIGMLFLCGYLYGQHAGLRPLPMGLSMVAIGGALVAVAIALGG